VYLTLLKRLRETLAGHIREKYGVELSVVLERRRNWRWARLRLRCVLSWQAAEESAAANCAGDCHFPAEDRGIGRVEVRGRVFECVF